MAGFIVSPEVIWNSDGAFRWVMPPGSGGSNFGSRLDRITGTVAEEGALATEGTVRCGRLVPLRLSPRVGGAKSRVVRLAGHLPRTNANSVEEGEVLHRVVFAIASPENGVSCQSTGGNQRIAELHSMALSI